MDTLTVFYLTDAPEATPAMLQDMEYELSDTFRAFCRERFTFEDPLDYPALRLIAVRTLCELDIALFHAPDERHFLSVDARHCCLFMLDDELSGRPLFNYRLDSLPLSDWFLTYFPAIPKILVTRPGHEKLHLPSRRWTQKPFSLFENAASNHERLGHLFASFWLPRFWDALRQYVRIKAGTNWHTPGHNGGNAFERSAFLHGFHDAFSSMIFRTDLSVSVESLGDLSTPEGHTPLSEAQRLTSEIFGTAQSCFVTNGTSTSNKAMLMTLLRPGETVLLDRNCHKSVHHAVVMSGAVPRYLPAHFNATLGVWGPIALDDLKTELDRAQALPEHRRPKMLVITTCTYEGILYPVWEIGRLCEEAGLLFYADEAWAPYLAFHPFYTRTLTDGRQVRYNAVNELGGAHFAVQSTHKALAAFSQASMIHVSNRFKALLETDNRKQFRWLRKRFHLHDHGSYEKFSHDLHEVLRYWHSTSPHYPTLATLDMAGIQMRLEGLNIIEQRLHWVAEFQARVATMVGRPIHECFAGLRTITDGDPHWKEDGYLHDPLKMMLTFRTVESCASFRKLLLGSHIQWEKSTPVTILFLVTAGTVKEHFDYLYRCIRQMQDVIGLPEGTRDSSLLEGAVAGQPAVLPRDAALCDGELLPLDECEGRICSQLLV
ncbi:MAG: aminotransferase class I/II-fold pyridoxal phosphate-dependent enzyme, partial [Kiritimatiellia bacterium]